MGNLQIEALLSASVYIPYTDYLRDGRTPFQTAVQNYIGGDNEDEIRAFIESLIPGKSSPSIHHPPLPTFTTQSLYDHFNR